MKVKSNIAIYFTPISMVLAESTVHLVSQMAAISLIALNTDGCALCMSISTTNRSLKLGKTCRVFKYSIAICFRL